MGTACGMRGNELNIHAVFWLEYLKVRCFLEDLGVDGKIIFKRSLKKKPWLAVECVYMTDGALFTMLMDVSSTLKYQEFND
jgi:hypothetical protein